MKTLNRSVATMLCRVLQLSALLLSAPVFAGSLYPATLEVRYGVANRVFGHTVSGTNALSTEFVNNSDHIKAEVSDQRAAIVGRDSFKMRYVLVEADDSDSLLLEYTMHIGVDHGTKTLSAEVSLVPGQWLILGHEISVTISDGHKTEEQFFVLVRVSSS